MNGPQKKCVVRGVIIMIDEDFHGKVVQVTMKRENLLRMGGTKQ